jgi:hypothetical protein
MGIVACCPNGHRIKVKDELAGKKGVCPTCAAKFRIPRKDAAPVAGSGDPLPTARVVAIDPEIAARLPRATPIDDGDTVSAIAPQMPDAQPDFVLVTDEPDDAPPPAAEQDDDPPPPVTPRRIYAALDDLPESPWLIAVRGGEPSPPLNAAALGAWLDSGAATADHVVWREGWPEWRPLVDVFPGVISAGSQGWT